MPLTRASNQTHNQGLGLIDLMITIALSLTVLLGVMTVTVTTLQSSNNNLQIVRLDQQLRTAMNIMVSEIRRAGYWTNAQNDVLPPTSSNSNPFMTSSTNISLPSSSCILFTYDSNSNGSLPALGSGTDDERYGFRLSGNAIQVRPSGAQFNCTAINTNWENMTDPTLVTITALTFTAVPTAYQTVAAGGASTITVRTITISVTGQLTSNTSITRTLTATVRAANDVFTP